MPSWKRALNPTPMGTGPVGYIEGWYVDEDVLGMGIVRAEVSVIKDWARDEGLEEIASETDHGKDAGFAKRLVLACVETGPTPPLQTTP